MKDVVKRKMMGAKWVLTNALVNPDSDPNERLIS